jgi:hypothetical protein
MDIDLVPKIKKGSNIIIGLGDSFTQGVGGYPEAIWRINQGKINCLDPSMMKKYKKYMYKYSWVSQLCEKHLENYIPVNLGCLGTGNRSASKEIFLYPEIEYHKANKVVVVYMMSGLERFDFIHKDFTDIHHFYTMWPNPTDEKSSNKKLWEAYASQLWSDRFAVIENIINIVDIQNLCKARGYELIIASAFDQRMNIPYFRKVLPDYNHNLIDLVEWDRVCYPQGCNSFMELLLKKEGYYDVATTLGRFYEIFSTRDFPSKYITTCVHPTIEGYRIMAEELYNYMVQKELV